MKKLLMLASLAVLAGGAQAQTIIFDTITGNTGVTTTGGVPRNRMADSFTTLAAGAGQQWRIDKIEFALYIASAGTWNISADVQVWNDWDGAAPTGSPVFSNSASNVTWNLGSQTTTGVAAFIYTLDYATANESFVITDGVDMGFEIQFYNNGLKDNGLALGLRDAAASVGSSSNLFYRDANDNGFIEASDGRTIGGWTNSNAMVRVTATAVPEPGTMIALGAGIAALAARRRRKN